MATKKQECYWYVLVMTNGGPVFVTGEMEHKQCRWNDEEPPMQFGAEYAKSMAFGLCVNGYLAYAVCSRIKLDHQPYRYDIGGFEWKEKEGKEEEA